MGVTITYPGTLPDINSPATFNERALELYTWMVGQGSGQLLGELADMDAADFFSVQSGPYDDSAGKVLTVGAFGLGEVAAISETDLDLFPQGFAITAFGTSLTNKPSTFTTSERAIVQTIGTTSAHFQSLLTRTNQRYYLRAGASVLGERPWIEVYTTSNLLGTVSQSGGDPTGAVIERGSNANGEYVRFADGTQFCTNGNSAITTNPAAFTGTVTNIDGDKLRIGRWF